MAGVRVWEIERVRGACPMPHGPAGWKPSAIPRNRSASGHAAAKAMRTRFVVSMTRAAILIRRICKVVNSEFENELPSGEVHSVEYMSAVGTWCGSVPGGDAARPMDGIVARLQQCASAWRRSRYRVGRLTPRSTASRTSCCAPRQTTERSPWPFPGRAPRTSSARDCAPEHWRIPP
jgi:hypothetical protein